MSDHYGAINGAVAREVMGWQLKVHVVHGHDLSHWEGGEYQPFIRDWNPAEFWADAGLVLDKMRAAGWWWMTDSYPGGSAAVQFQHVTGKLRQYDSAATPQLAICRAALAAVRAAKEKAGPGTPKGKP